MARELPKKYKHAEAESKWQEFWEDKKVYQFDTNSKRENNFIIDTPPPTVSGSLHIGHVFSYTQTDIIARHQRMLGKNIFYPSTENQEIIVLCYCRGCFKMVY